MPSKFKAALLAVDGSVTTNVIQQAARVSESATDLIVSAGGNDGLLRADILQRKARSVGDAVDQLAALRTEFHQNYRPMLTALLARKLPRAICTVYDPHFPAPPCNDCLLREAIRHGLPVLDLRLICTEPGDYANEIEPGIPGGRSIAAGILNLVQNHDFSCGRMAVYQ